METKSPEEVVFGLFARHIPDYREYPSTSNGRELVARCPFHKGGQERFPSFAFNLDKLVFNCYACNRSGGIPQFMKLLGYTREDVDHYLKDVDWRIKGISQVGKTGLNGNQELRLSGNYPLPESLIGMFDWTPLGLVNKGFPRELLQEYEIGYDRMNMRIIFPIRDVTGRLIALSGRADAPHQKPRYNVYTEELKEIAGVDYVAERSITLWNAHRVLSPYLTWTPKSPPQILIVEGFKAALRMIQYGYKNTVALMGASISQTQRYLLSLVGPEVFIFLDNNEAGLEGAWRVYEILRQSAVCRTHIVQYPKDAGEKCQPDDLDPATVERILRRAASTALHYHPKGGTQMDELMRRRMERDRRLAEEMSRNRGSGDSKMGFWRNEYRLEQDGAGGDGPTGIFHFFAGDYPVPPHVWKDYPERFMEGDVLPYYVHVKYYLKKRGSGGRGTYAIDTRDWCEGKDICRYLIDQGEEDISPGIRHYLVAIELGWWHQVKETKQAKSEGKEDYQVTEWAKCTGKTCKLCQSGSPRERGRPCYIELSENLYNGLGDVSKKIANYCACGFHKPLRVVSFVCSECGFEIEALDPTDEFKTSLDISERDAIYRDVGVCPGCNKVLDDLGEKGPYVKEIMACEDEDCPLPETRRANIYDVDIALRMTGKKSQTRLVVNTGVFEGLGFRIKNLDLLESNEAKELYSKAVLWDFHKNLETDYEYIGSRVLRKDEENPLLKAAAEGHESR